MSDRKGSSPKFVNTPAMVQRYAKQIQKDFKLSWTAALARAHADMGLMQVSFTYVATLLSVVFDSTVVLNGKTVDSYLWDFGDGGAGSGTATDADPTNVYVGAGTYRVNLTVTDTLGGVTTTHRVLTVAAS